MFKKQNEKGFTIIEVLLAIIAITIVSFVVWFVWNANQNDEKKSDISNSPAAAKSDEVKKDGDYYEIKELGIKFILPSELKGSTYKYEAGVPAAYFSSPDYNQVVEKCYGEKISSDRDQPTFGAVGRGDGQYPSNPSEDQLPMDPLIKQFPSFYIDGSRPNGVTTCTADGVDPGYAQEKTSDYVMLLLEAIEKTAVEL